MMKRVMACVLFLFLFSLFAFTDRSSASPEEWTPVDKGVYINEDTLTHLTGSVHSLWINVVPDKDSPLYTISRRLLRELGKEYESFAYMGYLTELDCMTGRFRQITTLFYQKDKNILGSLQKKEPQWQEITRGGMMTGVYNTVCGDFLSTEIYTGSC